MSVHQPLDRYEFDGFVLDARRRAVWRPDGTRVRLTARLFKALLLFVERPGELLDKNWLMARLWPGMDVGDNSLSQAVCGLRRALATDGGELIRTEWRQGFRFVSPVQIAGAAPCQCGTSRIATSTLAGSGGRAPSPTPACPA